MNYTKGEWKVRKFGTIYEVYSPEHLIADFIFNKANAHLVSAAPDMYEALKYIIRELDKAGRIKANSIFMEVPNKALAKAEGK